MNIVEGINKEVLDDEHFPIDEDYLLWFEKFTQENPSFMDCDWLYDKDRLTEQDQTNLNRLHLLYENVGTYADECGVNVIINSFQCSYFFQYHGVGYEIGLFFGNGVFVFCNRYDKIDELGNNFLNFDFFINRNKFRNELCELENVLNSMLEEGVPVQMISDTVYRTLREKNGQSLVKKRFLNER